MAYVHSPAEAQKVLRDALKAVEPDQVYHGGMVYGRYRYYGMGSRTIEFQPAGNSDKACFPARMTGGELAASIRAEIGLIIESQNVARRVVGLPEIENDLEETAPSPSP
jgi:hypothetical protein